MATEKKQANTQKGNQARTLCPVIPQAQVPRAMQQMSTQLTLLLVTYNLHLGDG